MFLSMGLQKVGHNLETKNNILKMHVMTCTHKNKMIKYILCVFYINKNIILKVQIQRNEARNI